MKTRSITGWWGELHGIKSTPWWTKPYEYDAHWLRRVEAAGYLSKGNLIPGRLIDRGFNEELEEVWGARWGAQGEIGKLRSVLVSPPTENEVSLEKEECPPLFFRNYSPGAQKQDLGQLLAQHRRFVEVLKEEVEEVIEWIPPEEIAGPYVRPCWLTATRSPVIINGGAIIQRFTHTPAGKGLEVLHENVLASLGVPILYTIHGRGSLTAGNWIWLDSEHVCLGNTVASNHEGITQATNILLMNGVKEVHEVHFPGSTLNLEWPAQGVLHLDLALGVADKDLAVYYGLPYETIEYLLRLGINLIEVPPNEHRNMACNLLALEPRRIIMPAGNPKTVKALKSQGVEVIEVDLQEFAKQGSGPHCLTLPLIREEGPSVDGHGQEEGVMMLAE